MWRQVWGDTQLGLPELAVLMWGQICSPPQASSPGPSAAGGQQLFNVGLEHPEGLGLSIPGMWGSGGTIC